PALRTTPSVVLRTLAGSAWVRIRSLVRCSLARSPCDRVTRFEGCKAGAGGTRGAKHHDHGAPSYALESRRPPHSRPAPAGRARDRERRGAGPGGGARLLLRLRAVSDAAVPHHAPRSHPDPGADGQPLRVPEPHAAP